MTGRRVPRFRVQLVIGRTLRHSHSILTRVHILLVSNAVPRRFTTRNQENVCRAVKLSSSAAPTPRTFTHPVQSTSLSSTNTSAPHSSRPQPFQLWFRLTTLFVLRGLTNSTLKRKTFYFNIFFQTRFRPLIASPRSQNSPRLLPSHQSPSAMNDTSPWHILPIP